MLNQLYPWDLCVRNNILRRGWSIIAIVLKGEHWFHVKVVHLRTGIRFEAEQEFLDGWSPPGPSTEFPILLCEYVQIGVLCIYSVRQTVVRWMMVKNRMPAISYPYVTSSTRKGIGSTSTITGNRFGGCKASILGTCV